MVLLQMLFKWIECLLGACDGTSQYLIELQFPIEFFIVGFHAYVVSKTGGNLVR